jgi:hypothetical protein
MFALRASALSADFMSAQYTCTTPVNSTQFNTMEVSYVEELLTQRARLLARRDSTSAHPCIDWSIEEIRQQALEMFYQFQDGMAQFSDLMPICMILEQKVNTNRDLIKWEREYGITD